MSALLGNNRELFFPKLDAEAHLLTFSEIAVRYLRQRGYEPVECATEDEARARVQELKSQRKWPVYFFKSDTTGEKDFEEFYTEHETIDWDRFSSIGVILGGPQVDEAVVERFEAAIRAMRARGTWTREELIDLFNATIPEFNHKETGKFLDGRM
jgi:hypothetical protein